MNAENPNRELTRGLRPTLVRRKGFAWVAGVVAMTFVQAELIPLAALAQGAPTGGPHRLALFVSAKTKKDDLSAMFLKALLRGAADRLVQQGYERAPTSPVEDLGALATVRSKVEDGRRQLGAQKWEDALNAYVQGEVELQKCLGGADRALVARVYKGLGIALANVRRTEEAKTAMKRSLAIYPDQKPGEYAYNLETQNIFKAAQREIVESPNGLMNISTNPPQAEVYVDYQSRDFSPVKVSGLTAGDHLVTVFHDGNLLWSKFVPVRGGPEENLDAALVPATNGKALDEALAATLKALDKGKGAQPELARLAEASVATDVVVLQVAAEKTGGFLLTGSYYANGNEKPLRKALPRDATLVGATQSVLADALGVSLPPDAGLAQLEPLPVAMPTTGGEAGVQPMGGEGEDSMVDPNSPIFRDTGAKSSRIQVEKEWWFWVALLGGAALIGGGAYGIWKASKGGGAGAPTGDLQINLHGAQ